VHHIGIVFAREDIAGPAHIGGKLINLVKPAVNDMVYEVLVAKVPDNEVIGVSLAKPRKFQVSTPHPKSFPLQTPNEVMTDEPARPADECYFPGNCVMPHVVLAHGLFTRIESQALRHRQKHVC